MKNNKGFTLIEILSVLIILGIIGVIVYPQINKIIEKNEEKTTIENTNKLMKSLDIYFASIDYKNSDYFYNINDVDTLNDSNWYAGFVTYNDDEISLVQVTDGKSCINGTSDDYTISEGACTTIPTNCFEFDEEKHSITGYLDNYACLNNPVIPSEINGIEVTSIGNSAFSYSYIESVSLPNSITRIENYAFTNCGFDKITIPDSVTFIGISAFSDNDLTSINIPDSVTYLGEAAFAHNSITKIKFPSTLDIIRKSTFWNNELTSIVIPPSITEIETLAFYNNKIEEITIPSTTTEIESRAFDGNSVTTINMPGRDSNDLGTSWYNGSPTFNFPTE